MINGNSCRTLLIGILLISAPVFGQVYRVVDDEGNVTYTDNPPANHPTAETVETVDVPTVNTQPAPSIDTGKEAPSEELSAGYSRVSITSPASDSTIPPGQRSVNVQLVTEPELQMGHNVQLWFDNKPYGDPLPTTSFQVRELERGEHHLQVKVLNEQGAEVATSKTVVIHVKRASIKPPPPAKPKSS